MLSVLEQPSQMIVPVITKDQWWPFLDTLQSWTPGSKPVVLISPHPDDETLGAGGLIFELRKGNVDVRVVAVTDGEKAYPRADGLGAIRTLEQTAALACLNVSQNQIVRLHLPDSAIASKAETLMEYLLSLCTADTHLIAPWTGDFHPDHEICGRVAQEVAKRTGATLTFYIFWSWHRGDLRTFSDVTPSAFCLSQEAQSAKANALAHHESQLNHESGEPILPENLLWPVTLPIEVFIPA